MSKQEVLLCEIDEETGYLLGGSPIVHCKDCKWHKYDNFCSNLNIVGFKDDGYCSFARRREDAVK